MIRKSFWLYLALRKCAEFLSRFFYLEDGFNLLERIKIRGNAVAIDVGSNDGTSVRMIRKAQPLSLVVCFDPVRKPRKSIKDVTFNQCALGNPNSLVQSDISIYVPRLFKQELEQYSSSSYSLMIDQISKDFGVKESRVSAQQLCCPLKALDSFNLNPYFIKVDVEGGEKDVILGSLSTIRKTRPILLIEIQSERSFLDIKGLLEPLMYFNLKWPTRKHAKIVHRRQVGNYDEKMNNYLWIPQGDSPSWFFNE